MPAIIRVLSGPGGVREHWIESRVMRIGSHPDSELCLSDPSIASHAITIEFRNKQYVVHNRSDLPLLIGKQPLEKQSKATWSDGQQLEFQGIAVLTLLVDRDPSPGPKPQVPDSDTETNDPSEIEVEANQDTFLRKPNGFSPKEMIQLAITIACVLGVVAILALKAIPQKKSEKNAPIATFSNVLEDRKTVTDADYLAMVDEVQEARVAKSKGSDLIATQKLEKVRTQLHQRRDTNGEFANEHERRLYGFVASQLSEK